jgi:cephalosporin-C deacetylase
VISDFDRFFLHLPPLDREKDFQSFWDRSIGELKKIPMDPALEKNGSPPSINYEIYNTSFNGAGKYKVKGNLFLPLNSTKPKVIILIHDYNQPFEPVEETLDTGLAYFFLQLRGHEFFSKIQKNNISNVKEDRKSPGFMVDSIAEIQNYYVKYIYLDVFRSVDFLRLNGIIDGSRIGIIGKGLGASAAVFAAGFSDRIKSLVLDTPSFCYLELSQNISRSDATNEINSFLSGNQSKKKIIKRNLSYFDSINLSDKINIPTLASVGLKDNYSSPECVFALFNHLKCEKTMEVYPEDDHSAGGKEQLKKAIQWSKEILLKED